MRKDNRQLAIILVAVAIFSVLFFAGYLRYSKKPIAPVYAPKGELIAGFPKELILDSKAKLDESYTINYDKNTDQYTADYNSDESMLGLFSEYTDYFKQNGWTITNETTKYSGSRGIYAKKDNTEASVAIIDQKTQRRVVVSYLKK